MSYFVAVCASPLDLAVHATSACRDKETVFSVHAIFSYGDQQHHATNAIVDHGIEVASIRT